MKVGQTYVEQVNVTGLNQFLRFTLDPPIGWAQGPFEVETVRFDPASRAIAVQTVNLPGNLYHGHPLMGWRYWKVFQSGPGIVTVETGALSRPALEFDGLAGSIRWLGFGIDKIATNQELTMWKKMIEDVNTGLNEPPRPGSVLKSPQSYPGLIGGKWDWMDKRYILYNLCGDAPPFSVPGLCK
jgi:hypothetical protein